MLLAAALVLVKMASCPPGEIPGRHWPEIGWHLATSCPTGAKLCELDHDDWSIAVVPDDPLIEILNTYASPNHLERIQVFDAWDTVTGDPNLTVAIIDTGIAPNEPDLRDNVAIGYNATCPTGRTGWDDHGHGTHVAGILGAVGDNGIGLAGVLWRVKMLRIKGLFGSGSGSTSDLIDAIAAAKSLGAWAINASWGGSTFSQAMQDAIADFPGLFVAAAGNQARDVDAQPFYPCSYPLPNILCVANSTPADFKSGSSNWGAVGVDVAAPGTGVLSFQPVGCLCSGRKTINNTPLSGTSMAAPVALGVAALVHIHFPGLTVAEVIDRVMATSDSVDWPTTPIRAGRVNAFRALSGGSR